MNPHIKNKKLIIFDFDDTLVQTINCKWAAIIETGKRNYKLKISPNKIKLYWGMPYKKMLKGVFGDIDKIENVIANYEETTKEFPMLEHKSAVKTVSKLLLNFKVSILTASGKSLVLYDLKRLGFPIEDLFFIQTSEDADYYKPDPRVFNPTFQTAENKGIMKNEIIYIGDAIKDYITAKDAGIDFLGISQGITKEAEFTKNKIPYIKTLPELI